MFAVRYKNIRALAVIGFSYNIYYFVQKEQVNIIGIIHHKRHPEIWKKSRMK